VIRDEKRRHEKVSQEKSAFLRGKFCRAVSETMLKRSFEMAAREKYKYLINFIKPIRSFKRELGRSEMFEVVYHHHDGRYHFTDSIGTYVWHHGKENPSNSLDATTD
jgi:hypothetical protein